MKCHCFRKQPVRVRKSHVIAAIWLLGIALAMPEYLNTNLEQFEYDGKTYFECKTATSFIADLYTVL